MGAGEGSLIGRQCHALLHLSHIFSTVNGATVLLDRCMLCAPSVSTGPRDLYTTQNHQSQHQCTHAGHALISAPSDSQTHASIYYSKQDYIQAEAPKVPTIKDL